MANFNDNPQFPNPENAPKAQTAAPETPDLESTSNPTPPATEEPLVGSEEWLQALLTTSSDSDSVSADQADDAALNSDELDLEKILAEDWDTIAGEASNDETAKAAPEEPANIPSEPVSGETVVFSTVDPSEILDDTDIPEDDTELPPVKSAPSVKRVQAYWASPTFWLQESGLL